jgi:hypothetical protein
VAASFDKDVWRQRAWDRFQRWIRGEKKRSPRLGAEPQWARDVIFVEKLAAAVGWCESRGVAVVFAKKPAGVLDTGSKVITISSRASPERQLYYLLHEAGHFLIDRQEHHERFVAGYPAGAEDPALKATFKYKITCLEEELEAWHRGWKLAKRLKLNLDRTAWDVVRLECLRSYAEWTTDDKGVKYDNEEVG